jgi:excisionase family DNA binding protein
MTETTQQERLAFSPDEVAASLGVSRDLVYKLIKSGELESIKAGKLRLISRQHLDAFLGNEQASDDTA